MSRITDQELEFIIQQKEENCYTWTEIVELYNKKFKKNETFDCIKTRYLRYRNNFGELDSSAHTLKSLHRIKRNNSYIGKENRSILDHWLNRDEILEAIEGIVKKISLTKYSPPKACIFSKKGNPKEKMTLEQLLSDIHYGKLVLGDNGNPIINTEEINRRVKKMSGQIIKEIARNSEFFDVEELVVGVLGDMIESSHIHGSESSKGCEFGTSRQVYEAIQGLFNNFFLPLAMTGIKIRVSCVCGNHDRPEKEKTYLRPGEEHFTYIIYKTLELLCKNSNLNNITFDIAIKPYNFIEIYGDLIIYEHGDELKNLNRDTLANLMNKRQNQINKGLAKFYRIGHWHESICYGQGKMQVNGCVPGQDGYSDGKGFATEAIQLLNYYILTDKRRTSFFRTFPIYLEEIKK